jgi:A/G-specific adenine glycosylase
VAFYFEVNMITPTTIAHFKSLIWDFYRTQGRQFPWRNDADPYAVVISEIMLQQTQTYRVEPKYRAFLAALPTIQDLAQADLRTVLTLWQGLGYNRRGKFLHEMAREIVHKHAGIIPDAPELLVQLPGIGKATAGSICAFAFNKPTVFIETNIRTVFIYHFFTGRNDIHDKEIMPLVAATVDQENPREWYYALMDYGVHLKKSLPNPSRSSKHHVIQSKFEGSDRQIRGAILRHLTQHEGLEKSHLIALISPDSSRRVERILAQLVSERLIEVKNNRVSIR